MRDYRAMAERMLKKAGGYYTFEDILERISNGTMQCFTKNNSVAVTQILKFPQKSVLEIVMAVGDIKDVLDLEKDVEKFARAEGVSALWALGRPGWNRHKHSGWRNVCHKFERAL